MSVIETHTYPKRVRIAGPADEEEIMGLCRALHAENGIFTMSDKKVREQLQNAFKQTGGLIGIIGPPGKAEAVIYMMLSSYWYSEEPHWEEVFLYVRPEFRRSENAVDLMRFAKWAVAETGFKLVIGVLSNHRTKGKARFYQRHFSEPVGNFFMYPNSEPTTTAH